MSQAKKEKKKSLKIKGSKESKKQIEESNKKKKNPTEEISKDNKKTDNEGLPKTSFKMNDYIVYPTQGVGKIIGIEEIKIKNQKKQYYVIEILEKKLIIKLPVENVEAAGIRNVIDKNEIKKVLKILEQEAEIPEEDWKIRYQNNLQKIKSGSIFEIAKVCRNLYKRAKDKELSLMERRLYETAFSLVTGEIAIAKGISLEESKNLVSDILSK